MPFRGGYQGGLDWFAGAATATAGQVITTDYMPVSLLRQMRFTLIASSGGSTALFTSVTADVLLPGSPTAISVSSGADPQTHLSVDVSQLIGYDLTKGQVGSIVAWGADANGVEYPWPTMGAEKIRLVLTRDATVATFVGNCYLSFIANKPMINPTLAAATVA